jgi:hypothetical protein
MKNLKLIGFLIIMASSLMFIGCTTDYAEIAGPAGQTGADGADGADGVAGADGLGIAECVSCHSDTHREAIYDSFDLSGHFLGTHTGGNYGSRESCSRCHSNDGYVDLLERGFVQPGGYYSFGPPEYVIDDNGTPDDPTDDFLVLEDDPDSPVFGLPVIENESFNNSAKIRCTTCHNVHRSFDFENDGNDKALRQGFMPVTFFADATLPVFDRGLSNTCANCHQPRNSYEVPVAGDDITITSSRYGPHHGPQSTMVEGLFGAEIAGSVTYPDNGTSSHAEASCITCHMGETTDGSDGQHSWWPTDNACAACHSTIPTEVVGFEAGMASLKAKLLALGAITDSDRTVTGTWPANVAMAVWNYRTLLEDQSNGIHNPVYSIALLQNSLAVLP